MATLDLDHVSKSFGDAAVLHDVALSIHDREFVVFVGPSGCGKSTLLRIVAGLEAASAGRILIDGRDVSGEHPLQRGISMVFQSYALYPHLTVFENIAFPLRVQRLAEGEVRQKVGRAADILQLTDKLALKPGQLSGGQRQRVAIGRSIVRAPKVFLFDEPLSNLDAALRGDMRVELSQLHRSLAATMVYVTHDQVEAMTMADRIVVLSKGRVEQFGTPMELYHHPSSRFVATFIGQPNMNLLPATVRGADAQDLAVAIDGGPVLLLPVEPGAARPGDRVEVGIRPENLHPVGEDAAGGGGDALAMPVQVLERLGGVSIAYGQVGPARVCASLPGDAPVEEGATLRLRVEPRDAHVFDAAGRVLRRRQAPSPAPTPVPVPASAFVA